MGIAGDFFFYIGRLSCYATNSVKVLNYFRFNGHFPVGPGLAGMRMSPFWILLEQNKG